MDKDDWRLLNDIEYLKNKSLYPTDGEEIVKYASYLEKCIFCWDKVQNSSHQRCFVLEDISCYICETCYSDFKEIFHWRKLDGWDIDWHLH